MSKINFSSEVNEFSSKGFIQALGEVPSRSSVDLYLNTPGGDIYAGGEMVNALRATLGRGVTVNVELGSLVASMGAAFLAAAKSEGCKVTAHANTEVMFHGCYTLTMGGADELTDTAKALADFNAVVKADLAKCGIKDCDSWFAADRQAYFNAKELKEMGLVDTILEDAATEDLAAEKVVAAKIAASLMKPAPEAPEGCGAEPRPLDDHPATEPAPEAPEGCGAEPRPLDDHPATEATWQKRLAGLQSTMDKKVAALNATITDLQGKNEQLAKDLAAAQAEVSASAEKFAKVQEDLDRKAKRLEDLENAHRKLTGGALTLSENAPAAKLPTLAEFYQDHGNSMSQAVKDDPETYKRICASMGMEPVALKYVH